MSMCLVRMQLNAISQRVERFCNLNLAVIQRSIGARWRTGGITAAAEVVYMIVRGWFAIALLWPGSEEKHGAVVEPLSPAGGKLPAVV